MATIADARHVEIRHRLTRRVLLSVPAPREPREGPASEVFDLSGVDFAALEHATREADPSCRPLAHANLSGAILRRACLRGVDLEGADLRGADLRDANLEGAIAECASFEEARLDHASLRRADLSSASLASATLISTDLSEAQMLQTYLRSADLTRAKPVERGYLGSRPEVRELDRRRSLKCWHGKLRFLERGAHAHAARARTSAVLASRKRTSRTRTSRA